MGIGEMGLTASYPSEFTIVRTKNSVYELDRDGKRVRRLFGMNEPTPRMQDVDHEGWRAYEELYPLTVGGTMIVRFQSFQGMQTSVVTAIETPGGWS